MPPPPGMRPKCCRDNATPGRKCCSRCLARGAKGAAACAARRKTAGVCVRCGSSDMQGLQTCKGCAALESDRGRALKERVVAAYGGACACCGETFLDFLCVDHVHSDGAADRLKGRRGVRLHRVLEKEGYPQDRYQLLCANCNLCKHIAGGAACRCPRTLAPKSLG